MVWPLVEATVRVPDRYSMTNGPVLVAAAGVERGKEGANEYGLDFVCIPYKL